MPAVLLALLRPLVIWIVQIAVTTIIADALAAMLKKVVGIVAAHYNIPEDDAKVVVTNQLIDIAAIVGVGTGTLYSKLGVKAADYLGLKSAGSVKKALSAAATTKVIATDAAPASKTLAQKAMAAIGGGELLWKGILFTMLLQQVGDWFIFGRPQLQGYIDAVFGQGNVQLPTATSAPPPFSNATWQAYYTGLESAGVVGIESPAALQSLLYSRDALVQLVWWGYSQELKAGTNPTEANVKKAIFPHLVFKDKAASATVEANTTTSATTASASSTAAPTQSVQVYTGIVANGTLGTPQEFVARPDDMIDSAAELSAAASNNLASWIMGLAGRLQYEIGIVSTVKTEGGFTVKGAAVKLLNGYNTNGTPKYKTVYNKFAEMRIFTEDATGRKVRLADIVLGPVNAASYSPTAAELASVSGTINSNTFTTNTDAIANVVSNTPTTSTTATGTVPSPKPTAEALAALTAVQLTQYNKLVADGADPTTALTAVKQIAANATVGSGDAYTIGQRVQGKATNTAGDIFYIYTYKGNDTWGVGDSLHGDYNQTITTTQLRALGVNPSGAAAATGAIVGAPAATTAPAQSTATQSTAATRPTTLQAAELAATTLSQFYAASGQALPSLSVRAQTYAAAGLGGAATYAGTAEQNNRLLAWLKSQI